MELTKLFDYYQLGLAASKDFHDGNPVFGKIMNGARDGRLYNALQESGKPVQFDLSKKYMHNLNTDTDIRRESAGYMRWILTGVNELVAPTEVEAWSLLYILKGSICNCMERKDDKCVDHLITLNEQRHVPAVPYQNAGWCDGRLRVGKKRKWYLEHQ